MIKYFEEDGIKLKIDGNKGFIKYPGKDEKEIPHTSKIGKDILLSNNEITKEEYDK